MGQCMNELEFFRTLKSLLSVMGGIAESYKQFNSEYPLNTFTEQIDRAYTDAENKLLSLGFEIKKTESIDFTDFESSVLNYSELPKDLNCYDFISFLTMFFYSKIESKDGRYKDLLNRDYSKLYTEIDSLISECRKNQQSIKSDLSDWEKALFSKGLIDEKKRVICYSLQLVASTLYDELGIKNITRELLKRFINPKTNKPYSVKMLDAVVENINATRK